MADYVLILHGGIGNCLLYCPFHENLAVVTKSG